MITTSGSSRKRRGRGKCGLGNGRQTAAVVHLAAHLYVRVEARVLLTAAVKGRLGNVPQNRVIDARRPGHIRVRQVIVLVIVAVALVVIVVKISLSFDPFCCGFC